MMKRASVFFPFLLVLGANSLFSDTKEFFKEHPSHRIESLLTLRQYEEAFRVAEELLLLYPHSERIVKASIHALAKNQKITQAISLFEREKESFSKKERNALLEVICWGVLEGDPRIIDYSILSMMGATATSDIRAIPILLRELESPDALVRYIALDLAKRYPDKSVSKKVHELLKKEQVWFVRQKLYEVVGSYRTEASITTLMQLLENPSTLFEERLHIAAILSQNITPDEIVSQIPQTRASFKILLAHLALKGDGEEFVPLLESMLDDPLLDVRIAAISVIGKREIFTDSIQHKLGALLFNQSAQVSFLSSWALAKVGNPSGFKYLQTKLVEGNPSEQKEAAMLLASCYPLSREYLIKALDHKDPFIRLHVALPLLDVKEYRPAATKEIYRFLTKLTNPIMKISLPYGGGEAFIPSSVLPHPRIRGYPAYVDQMSRLRLIELLAAHEYPLAQKVLSELLSSHQIGVSFSAAMIGLRYGGDRIIDSLRTLISHPDKYVQLQAAMVLALAGDYDPSLSIIHEALKWAPREIRAELFHLLAYVAHPSSVAPLIEQIKQPIQLFQVLASSALIQLLRR